jgi:hypothetical protein
MIMAGLADSNRDSNVAGLEAPFTARYARPRARRHVPGRFARDLVNRWLGLRVPRQLSSFILLANVDAVCVCIARNGAAAPLFFEETRQREA